jgi:hypothetical protein
MRKFKKLASAAAVSLALSLAAGAGQAAVWDFEDDDVEAIFTRNTAGDLTLKTSGSLAVGDVFVAAFELPVFNINLVNAIPAGMELTGVAAIEIVNIIPSGVPGGIGTVYQFRESSGGLNEVLGLASGGGVSVGAAGDAGGGAVIAMFLNGTSGAGGDIDLDLNRTSAPGTNCTNVAGCLDQASRGSLFQVDGFIIDGEGAQLDTDEFWQAVQVAAGGDDIGTVLGLNNALPVAQFAFALGNFFNAGGDVQYQFIATGLPCGDPGPVSGDGCAQLVGSGTVTGGSGLGTTGFIAHSDFDAVKLVPEPGVLALLGAALLGFGARRKRVA